MTMTSDDMQQAIEKYCEGEEVVAANLPEWGCGPLGRVNLRFKSGKLLSLQAVLVSNKHGIVPSIQASIGQWLGHPAAGFGGGRHDTIRENGSVTTRDAFEELVDKENERYERGDAT